MDLIFALEQRFSRTPDGAVWTQAMYANAFWDRYVSHFDSVRVLARVGDVEQRPEGWLRVDGSKVSVHALPHYVGPLAYIQSYPQLRQAVADALVPGAAVILRAPGPIAFLAASYLAESGYPFAMEVVGDPWDVFAPGAIRTPLRPFLRRWFARQLRRSCEAAVAVLYVTERALQRRYPARGFSTFASNVELNDAAFVDQPRVPFTFGRTRPRIIFVGSLAQLYKGPDVLLEAVAIGARRGVNCEVVMVGDGRFRPQLERLAQSLGVADSVRFVGALRPGPAIRSELDQADVFVLPSRTEGMPRALIEAMARGLPCISTSVGGIPELLPAECLVPAGDAATLANRLVTFFKEPSRVQQLTRRNLEVARSFHENVLQTRRKEFYAFITARTQEWLACRSRE